MGLGESRRSVSSGYYLKYAARELVPGGFVRRSLAYLIDLLIVGAISLSVVYGLAVLLRSSGLAHTLIGSLRYKLLEGFISVGILALYFYFSYALRGTSLGKACFKLRVLVRQDEEILPGLFRTLMREIVGRSMCFLSLGTGFLPIIFSSSRRGLHDYVSGTSVVRERRPELEDTRTGAKRSL